MEYSTFTGNLKKSNCSVTKLETIYNQADCRCWSAIINQGSDNVIVTHSVNRYSQGTQLFDVFASSKIVADVEPEDVFDTIDLLVTKTETAE